MLLRVFKSIIDNFRYVGITNNLEGRINQHNKGMNKSTRLHKPFQLIFSEKYENYKEARKREIFLKSGQGRKFLDGLEKL